MAALVQTLPPQTFTMHSGRPSSSGGYSSSQASQLQQQRARYSHQSGPGYRGMPSTGPVAPYAFTSTPQLANLNSNLAPRAQNTSHSGRSASTSILPQAQQTLNNQTRPTGQRQQSSSSASPSLSAYIPLEFSTSPVLDLSLTGSPSPVSIASANAAKPSPDRYRRNVKRVDSAESGPNRVQQGSSLSPGSGVAAVGQIYSHPVQSSSSPSLTSYQSYRGSTYGPPTPQAKSSADDIFVGRSQNAELAARYRRRSLGSIETAGLIHTGDAQDTASPHPNAVIQPQSHQSNQPSAQTPASHAHTGSSESIASSRSGRSSRPTSARTDSYTHATTPGPAQAAHAVKQDVRLGNVPARQSDSSRRNPSPLSNPVNLAADSHGNAAPARYQPPTQTPVVASPAAEHLAAVSQKDGKKSKSKLRRAFSFGSAAELRKATAQANLEKSAAAHASNKRNSKYEDEMEPEQARIAEKQEAAGLGESIYSGQGQFFTGSTDNLSISSTASSASIMLRKMGKGVKKGTRSLVGLFRPKSVIGVPAADGPVNEGSAAQVSMVTVEAEREKVNVNVDPHDHAGGGTGFPKLERNSLDNKLSMDSGTVSSETRSRRSIVGGEKERAEVLASVKKGILKRTHSNQPSPHLRTVDAKVSDFNLRQIPHTNDSPRSSAPSTPADEPPRSGHRRTDSITIEDNDHDDYFSSVTGYPSLDSKTSVPLTPQAVMRNISFSPRIQFHDTWPSGEYDRRGEIATCNRLTPMLAQQIKEELNSFKMEMEVHESSKVYTHFF